ncbi:hypothetical protein P3G55_00940 [Leptospira sp. 96542]|nr:hypothetical protein [Leptospira sp. 96542]
MTEVIDKINGYLYDFKDPSEYKISGSITFWIRKLKPFTFELSESESNPCLFLNEVIAVLYGYTYIRASKKQKKEKLLNFSSSYLSDFSTQLRYSSFSPSSIALFIRSNIFTFRADLVFLNNNIPINKKSPKLSFRASPNFYTTKVPSFLLSSSTIDSYKPLRGKARGAPSGTAATASAQLEA